MRKRKILWFVTGLCIALLAGAIFAYAAPSNTRGRVAVDIGDFVYVDHDGGRSRGLSDEGNGTKYKLYYENYMISNHDNDGVTYRSKNTYDMTDVVNLEFSAYTQTDDSDKFMIYTTSSDYKTFHGKDRDDINDSMYSGQSPAANGKVYSFSSLSTQISNNIYSSNFHYKNFNTDNTYENRYVYIAMSKAFDWAKQGIMLENNTYMVNNNGEQIAGGINLKLKEHKVQLIAPDKPTRIDIDNNEVTNTTAYSDLEIKMNDGESYAHGKKASLYRGEEIVLSYKWGAGVNGKVIGYNFYADAEKKTKLYQMNTTSGNIKFNSALIQDIETTSGKDLGDFYLEPIFQYDQATIKVSDSVAETENLEIRKASSSAYDYVITDKTAGDAVVGTIHLNKAKYVGDYLRIEYERNTDYHGDYAISGFLLALCETEEQVNTTTNTAFFEPSATAVDYNQQIQNKYIRILPRIKLHAEVKLKDKTVTFSNSKVQIDPAEVTYPQGAVRPPGANKITYQYYVDEECKNSMEDDPINAGTYYVIATMPGDTDYYAKAVSNKAKLTIEKAVPTLEHVRGRQAITYGQDLTNTAGITGTAKGVSGSSVAGEFAWADPGRKPDAGYRLAKVIFTPTGAFATNYTEAEGNGLVTVKADDIIVYVPERVRTYDGQPPAPSKAVITGKTTGQATGQTAKMSYYADEACTVELPEIPVYAGTFYALARVSAEGNYNGGTGKGTLLIREAYVDLVQVPFKDGAMTKAEYRVYMQGAGVKPLGTVTLDVGYGSVTRQLSSSDTKADAEGRFYAVFDIDEVKKDVPSGVTVEVKANYVGKEGFKDYKAYPSVQQFYEGTLAAICTKTYQYGDDVTYQYQWKNEAAFTSTGSKFDDTLELNTVFPANSDVAEITLSNKGKFDETVSVKPKNTGTTYVLTRIAREQGIQGTDAGFLMYEIIVEKAAVSVALQNKTVTYNGYPVTIDEAAVSGVNLTEGAPLPDDMYVSYYYYSDATCENLLAGPPTDPGTYYVKAETNETKNYKAGESQTVTLTIEKATADISMKSKIVKYDGKPHKLDDAVVQGSVSVIPKEDEGLNNDINQEDAFMPASEEVTYVYTDKDGNKVADIDQITEAGLYKVTASLTDDPIYKDTFSEPAYLLIVPEHAKLSISNAEKVYDGLPVEPEITFEVDGVSIPVPEEAYVEYALKNLAGNNVTKGLPVQAGNYYIRAAIDEGNYWSTFSELGEVTILRADVELTLDADYEAEYSGVPVVFDHAKAVSLGRDVIEEVTITYEYYSDEDCTEIIDPPEYPGTYYVKAFSKDTRNYNSSESKMRKIIIKKRPVYLSELKIHSADKVTGKAKNKEGVLIPGTFHIVDTETFWMLSEGTHQVQVEFVPDTEASKVYFGETGFAPYTVVPTDDPDSDKDPDDGQDPAPSPNPDPDGDKNQDGNKKPDGDESESGQQVDDLPNIHEEKNETDIPAEGAGVNTGDPSILGLYLLLTITALLGVVELKKIRKMKR